jgi:MoaA/NifB/PqqE/SkfB family radical SAM enzyme
LLESGIPSWKLWIYTNYDCNLACTYCVARSHPKAPRRAIGLDMVTRLVDEAAELGFERVLFTGGEPLALDEIYLMLAYAAARLPTTLLTNAVLARGKRLERLAAVNHPNLTIQVSLDGARAEHHDPYRGAGSWQRTLDGLRLLQQGGFRVKLATTETPANCAHLDELSAFRHSLGIAEEDHVIRAMAHRGFATEGVEVDVNTLAPEITVDDRGMYWHPLGPEDDMRLSCEILPLAEAVRLVQERLPGLSPEGAPKDFK